MTHFRRLIAGLALAAIFAAGAIAAPPLTLIQDRLFKADGTPFNGAAVISWRSFVASNGSNIPQNSVTVQITGGVLNARLVPTTNASAGAYYSVRFNSDGKTQFTESWAVPPSALPLQVRHVRLEAPPGAPVLPPSSLIQIGDVTGLAEALIERPLKALAYRSGRAAVIDSNGDLAGASGIATDCIRVDGTSGPCGSQTALPLFVDMEPPTGLVNGVNLVFTLNQAPAPASSLHLFRNGVLQRPAVDYVLNGNAITFLSVSTPQTGDQLAATYRAAQ
ncbi:MAG: hypothetical protein C0504_03210 [Candidatus Solibacter sp.]|nr:hypothetical protein [Candidatus Solibacter sp.]